MNVNRMMEIAMELPLEGGLEQFQHEFSQALGVKKSIYLGFPEASMLPTELLAFGIDEQEYLPFLFDHYLDNIWVDTLYKKNLHDSLFIASDHIPDKALFASPWYQEFLKQRDMHDVLGFSTVDSSGQTVNLSFFTSHSSGAFTSENKLAAAYLFRFVQKNMQLRLMIEQEQTKSDFLYQNSTSPSALFLSSRGRIEHYNAPAEQQLLEGDGISIINNEIVLSDKSAQSLLKQILNEAKPSQNSSNNFVSRRPSGHPPYLIQVLPYIDNRIAYGYSEKRNIIRILDINNTSAGERILEQDLRSIFELSEAEAAVAILAGNATPVANIATHRNVAEKTVRNQLNSIYEKMGVRGKDELIHVVSGFYR